MAKVKRRATVQVGGSRDQLHTRTARPGKKGQRPYARFREIVFLFTNVAATGGTLVGQTPSLNNDVDVMFKRGCMNVSSTANRTNNLWQVAIEYLSGEKVTTPAQTSGTSLAIASATLGIDGMGGYIDPPLRVRATVTLQVTVQNNDSQIRNLCVVLGIREWYFASDAEN